MLLNVPSFFGKIFHVKSISFVLNEWSKRVIKTCQRQKVIIHFLICTALQTSKPFDKGSFTNYVMHSSLHFDHPPTYGYVFAIILPNIYLTKFAMVIFL